MYNSHTIGMYIFMIHHTNVFVVDKIALKILIK